MTTKILDLSNVIASTDELDINLPLTEMFLNGQ